MTPLAFIRRNRHAATRRRTPWRAALLPVLLLLGATSGCAGEEGSPPLSPPPPSVDLVEIRPLAPEVFVGQRLLLEALPTDGNGEDLGQRPTVWASSDEAIATVTQGGLVEGIAPGEVRISATVEGVEGAATLRVTRTPLGRVVVEPGTLNLVEGESASLGAKVLDVLGEEVEAESFTWRSSDEAVAEVDAEGRVDGVGPGEARIYASFEGVEGSSKVWVVAAPIEKLEPLEKEVSIYTGRRRMLEVEVVDANGKVLPEARPSWRSTIPSIADVSDDGELRAWSPGQTTVVVSIADLKAYITVTVSRMPVTRVVVEPEAVTAQAGDEVELVAYVFGLDPEPFGGEEVSWSSSDEALATVNERGRVRLLGRGVVEVTATAGGVSSTSTITIRRTPAIARVEIDSPISIARGADLQLEARVFDVNGEQVSGLPLEWSADDPSIASVDEEGRLLGHAVGETEVRVSVDGVAAVATIQVYKPFTIAEVKILGSDGEVLLGERRQLRAEAFDDEGRLVNFVTMSWSSSDEAVATVSGGEVIAHATGPVTIAAEALGTRGTIELQVRAVQFSRIRARRQFFCALTTIGELYCWGTPNAYGLSEAPAKLFGDGRYRELSVGDQHVCVIDFDSNAFCGGENAAGQLGDGTTTRSWGALVPVAGGLKFQSIEAGGVLSCGVTTEGRTYCWGWAGVSQDPLLIFEEPVPVPFGDELGFSSIRLSSFSYGIADFMVGCGLASDGKAHCWGANGSGELGDGSRLPSLSPQPAGGGLLFSSLMASTRIEDPRAPGSSRGHGCGVVQNGDAYCWGSNQSGELGIGAESELELSPKKVGGGHVFQEIHTQTGLGPAMDATSCGLDVEGGVLCWGLNDHLFPSVEGAPTRTPVAVGGSLRFQSISLGVGSLCGIADGKAYCWGLNYTGPSTVRPLGVYDRAEVVRSPSLVLGQRPDPPPAPEEGDAGR